MSSTYSPRLFLAMIQNRTSREGDPTGRLLRISRHLPFTTTLYIEGIHTIREGNIERKCVTVKVRGGRAMLKEGRGLRLMVLHQKENKLKMYREGDSCILNMGDVIKITRSISDKLVAFGMNYAVVGFYSPELDISPSRDLKLIPKAATYYDIISSHSILEKEKEIIATKKLNVLFEMIKSNSSRFIDITAAKKVATKKLNALFKLVKSKLSRIEEISNPNPTNALMSNKRKRTEISENTNSKEESFQGMPVYEDGFFGDFMVLIAPTMKNHMNI